MSGFFSVERGIVGVIQQLTTNPRKVISNYWSGNRYYYYSPGQMIFYTIFVLGLHVAFIDPKILGFSVVLQGIPDGASTLISPQVFLTVLILPLYATTTYISFYKTANSFPEHFISATYVFTYGAIVSTVANDILFLLFDVSIPHLSLIFLLLIFGWASRIFLADGKWHRYLLFTLLQIIVFTVLAAILIGILFLVYPENTNFSTGN